MWKPPQSTLPTAALIQGACSTDNTSVHSWTGVLTLVCGTDSDHIVFFFGAVQITLLVLIVGTESLNSIPISHRNGASRTYTPETRNNTEKQNTHIVAFSLVLQMNGTEYI